jgi:hypothetical protein
MIRLWPLFAARVAARGQTRAMGSAGNGMNAVITQGLGGGGPNLAGPIMRAGGAGMVASEAVAAAGVMGAAWYINKEERKWGGSPAQTHPGLTGILSGIGAIALSFITFGIAQPYPESHAAAWFVLVIGLAFGIWAFAKGCDSAAKSKRKSGVTVSARPAPIVSRQAYFARERAKMDTHAVEALEVAAKLRARGL